MKWEETDENDVRWTIEIWTEITDDGGFMWAEIEGGQLVAEGPVLKAVNHVDVTREAIVREIDCTITVSP